MPTNNWRTAKRIKGDGHGIVVFSTPMETNKLYEVYLYICVSLSDCHSYKLVQICQEIITKYSLVCTQNISTVLMNKEINRDAIVCKHSSAKPPRFTKGLVRR